MMVMTAASIPKKYRVENGRLRRTIPLLCRNLACDQKAGGTPAALASLWRASA